jgi:DNA processing protein
VLVTDAAEVAELVGRLGEDLAPEPSRPRTERDELDAVTRQVLDALPVRSGRPVGALCRTAGLDEASVVSALGRLQLRDLAERQGDGWRLAPRARSAGGGSARAG